MSPPAEGPATLGAAHELLRLALARELRQVAVPLAVDLRDAADRAVSTAERRALSEAAGRLLQEADLLAPRAAQALARPAARRRDEAAPLEWPRLLDDAALEQQIVAAELAQAVHEIGEGVGATWGARLRALGATDREIAALGADGACAAVIQALAPVSAEESTRRALRPLLLRRLPQRLVEALRTADEQLAMQGVLPAPGQATLPRRPQPSGSSVPSTGRASAPAGVREKPPPDSPPPLSPEAIAAASTLLVVRRVGEAVRSGSMAEPQAPLGGLLPFESDGLRFAQAAGVPPYSAAARSLLFRSARERLSRAGASAQQCELVDAVGALFDYALDDARLPDSAGPLLWELQAPVLALALADDRYMADTPHSLSRLVEHVAALVAAFPADAAKGGKLQPRLDAVVQGVRAVAGALQIRSSVLAVELGRQFDAAEIRMTRIAEEVGEARGAVEASAGSGRNRRDWRRRPDRSLERAVTDRLARLIDERLEARAIGAAVKDFVADVWLRHLRTTVLRDGEESLQYRVALQVLDDLLWSAEDARGAPDRRELVERIPPLIRLLSEGIRAVGGDRAAFAGFFDELFRIHERKLAREPDRGRRASRVDLQALVQDVDLDDYPHDAGRRRLSPALVAAALRVGDWLELVDRAGRVSHAKVGWLDSRRRAVVLVRWPDCRPLSLRMSALVERFGDGRACLLVSSQPPPASRGSLLSDE